jgi:DNA repair protein RecO (recombination protein O)
MVYGVNSKKNKLSAFQHLFILDLQIYYNTERNIQKLKEYKINPPLLSLTSDIRKSTLAMFIAEVISKSVKEEHKDAVMFFFLKTSILFLNELNNSLSLFHLIFLLKLSRLLGFSDFSNNISTDFYNYTDGSSISTKPYHNHFFTKDEYELCEKLIQTNFDNMDDIILNRNKKNNLLYKIIDLYKVHNYEFNNFKSYSYFKEIFSI